MKECLIGEPDSCSDKIMRSIAGKIMTKPFNGAPDFACSLHKKIDDLEHRSNCLDDTRYDFKRSGCDNYFITAPISQIASKYLLAERTIGLEVDGYSGEDPAANYSGQVIFTLIAATFETYCRLIGPNAKWFNHYWDIFTDEDGQKFRAAATDSGLTDSFYSRVADAQTEPQMETKINAFMRGEDQRNFYAVCVGFRNAFSHGRLGSLEGTLPMAKVAREIVLNAIQRDCIAQTGLIK